MRVRVGLSLREVNVLLTPKPCIMRNERGIPRSLMTQLNICVASEWRYWKSQKLLWAL